MYKYNDIIKSKDIITRPICSCNTCKNLHHCILLTKMVVNKTTDSNGKESVALFKQSSHYPYPDENGVIGKCGYYRPNKHANR